MKSGAFVSGQIGRRAALAGLGGTLAIPLALPRGARAADAAWPTRTVTIIVPFAAGGSNDTIARLFGPVLQGKFGQSFVADNRTGGGGAVGTTLVARAQPDGYTMLLSSASNHVLNPLVAPGQTPDTRTALSGISQMEDIPLAVSVPAKSPVKNVAELIAMLKREPGKHSYASSGVGGSQHLAGELFKIRAGVDMVHVPYRGGGPALSDLMAGQVSLAFLNLPTAFPQAQAGSIRILAVTSGHRSKLRPEIPTVAESGLPGYEVRSWTGLFAPRGTPSAVLERVSSAVREAAADPAMQARCAEMGIELQTSTPAELDKFVRDEFALWEPVVRSANVSVNN